MPAKLAGYLAFSLFIFRFSLSLVGAYCIRPTNDPKGADTCLLDALFSSVRVGAYYIRPTKRPDRGGCKTMGRAKFLRVGAYNMDVGGVAP